jgi:hypothetical protein
MAVKWKKASRSEGASNCIELANAGMVRDSKNPAGPTLTVDLTGLLNRVKAGTLEWPRAA